MVFLSRLLLKGAKKGKKGKPKNVKKNVEEAVKVAGSFIDTLRVYVRGGGGGMGLPKYGGMGGNGGNVYLVGRKGITMKHVASFHPTKRLVADPGENSSVDALLGAPGKDLEVVVPLGTDVTNDEGRLIGEINQSDERLLVARGGPGGGPQNDFTGSKANAAMIKLDLKLLADIGLVGFPNAGKSTLLKALSRATPHIANYPFTTLHPQIGTMVYKDNRQITLADLPGLIEGAHMDIGLGHKFLKHVERTKIMLFVVNLHGFQLAWNHNKRMLYESVLLLNKEIELYNEKLLDKPCVLAINQIDREGSEPLLEEAFEKLNNFEASLKDVHPLLHPTRFVKFEDIITVSAKEQQNTELLKDRLREMLDIQADKAAIEENLIPIRKSATQIISKDTSPEMPQTAAAMTAAEKVRKQLTEKSDTQLV